VAVAGDEEAVPGEQLGVGEETVGDEDLAAGGWEHAARIQGQQICGLGLRRHGVRVLRGRRGGVSLGGGSCGLRRRGLRRGLGSSCGNQGIPRGVWQVVVVSVLPADAADGLVAVVEEVEEGHLWGGWGRVRAHMGIV
jgi:hypothetical protein